MIAGTPGLLSVADLAPVPVGSRYVNPEAVIRSATTRKAVSMAGNIRLPAVAGPSGVMDLWEGLRQGVPPFWAAVWTSGKALGRHLLDHPHIVSGREVLDVGSGYGIVAIASVKAGARKVVACDIDPQSWLIGQVQLCDAESAK